jgi:hypothetical protein
MNRLFLNYEKQQSKTTKENRRRFK